MGHLSVHERAAHDAIIQSMGLTLPSPVPTIEAVKERAMADSKRGVVGEADDEFSEVLLTAIGAPLQSKSMLHAVKWNLAEEWLASIGCQHTANIDESETETDSTTTAM